MKRLWHIICIFYFIYCFCLLKTGFVVEASANPVSLLLSEEDDCYKLSVYLNNDAQMNAFQLKLDFDNKDIDIVSNVEFYSDFLKKYNGNNGAMLKCRYNENKSNVLFLGVQTDNACAFVRKNTVISEILFKPHSDDAGEIAKQLDSIVMTIEVLEGLDGNIVNSDSEWTVYANRKNNNSNGFPQEVGDDVGQDTMQGEGVGNEGLQGAGTVSEDLHGVDGQSIGAGNEATQGESVQGTGAEGEAAQGESVQGTGAGSEATQSTLVQGTGAGSEAAHGTAFNDTDVESNNMQSNNRKSAQSVTKKISYISLCFVIAAIIVITVIYVYRRKKNNK